MRTLIILMVMILTLVVADEVGQLIIANERTIQSIYGKYLENDPKLEGMVMIWVALGSTGNILSSGISQNSTGDPDLADELYAMVKGWTFTTTKNQTVQVRIQLTPPPPGAIYTGRGTRTVSEMDKAFSSKQSALSSFYDQRKVEKPGLQGVIRLKVSITESGRVSSVTVVRDEPKDQPLTDKFISLVQDCKLPDGPAGEIEYEMTFVPFGKWSGK